MPCSSVYLSTYAKPLLSGGGSTTVTASDWAQVITDVTSQFSVTNIVGVISAMVVAGIGFVFLWWGVRKGLRSIMSAVKRGRAKI